MAGQAIAGTTETERGLDMTVPARKAHDPQGAAGKVLRVLVVDDSRLQRRILTTALRKWGFAVNEADSGEHALTICAREPPDLVLSDWVMDGMSGVEFCRAFRQQAGSAYGYFILLTSRSEKGDVTAGLDAGADDFLTKPVDMAELRARLVAGARIVAMQRELAEKNRAITRTLEGLQAVHARIDQDLLQARKIQESLVPETSRRFGASRFDLLMEPCGHIGGDLVGLFSPGLNRVGFYCIDVSGHGITSALMTARLAGYLSADHFDQNVAMEQRQFAFYGLKPPAEVARVLNARLMASDGIDEYFTMIYGTVDLYRGEVKLVQCGHPHPMVMRRDGRIEFLGRGGMPLGLLDNPLCDEISVRLEPGDRLLIYSDGITECRVSGGAMLGEAGLADMAGRIARERAGKAGRSAGFLEDLYRRLSSMLPEGASFEDDVSAVLLDYNGV